MRTEPFQGPCRKMLLCFMDQSLKENAFAQVIVTSLVAYLRSLQENTTDGRMREQKQHTMPTQSSRPWNCSGT